MALDKYLKRYAEIESHSLAGFSSSVDSPLFKQRPFKQCLVIPMYRESIEALQYFYQFAERQKNTLLIIILNRPNTDQDTAWAKTIFEHVNKPQWQNNDKTLTLHPLKNSSGLLIVDRCINGNAIPKDQGVGLARKIGNDIACQLLQNHQLQSPWIFNSDADAVLPDDYFTSIEHDNLSAAAQLFPYQHVSAAGGKPHLATQLYELSLHYYVEGLRWADSPYAYHTLGSIICVNAQHYAKVRGFPKRAGAEDFYLLNKLAKTGDIVSLNQPTINLTCRQSNRVPFGTGPAVTRIIELGQFELMPFYAPEVFHYLKAFNRLVALCSKNENITTAINSLTLTGIDQQLLSNSAAALKLSAAVAHAHQQGNTEEKRLRHLHTWFDAFKSLKLLHYIRDHQHPMISYKEWQKRVINEPYASNLAILSQA